ncbi:archaellin/type IV pilin N-terminal domain-containing protein [Methanoplanus endosymbiosus]|uniref:Flagellin n=1 Tax=Methanoplanus endosymbiosus TaxID=33865 RepID=A0A9E7TJK1_9EURY|nr:archaellin/type IV pilin N-terminal domain-containing protein [Methanoplanus endosymbiosus]UUX91815.1 flagellin [Methanoplanus endosymbiosus]
MLKIRNDEAFTGLEAAIVLIAFVVVAAVFSYVVLGAGFFTTQKSQEVVYTSVDQASSSIEIMGDVYGISETTEKGIDTVRFTVGLTAGGSPVDFSDSTMSFTTKTEVTSLGNPSSTVSTTLPTEEGDWKVLTVNNRDSDKDPSSLMLEGREQFVLGIRLPSKVTANNDFILSIRPAVGTAYSIDRTVPERVKAVNALY